MAVADRGGGDGGEGSEAQRGVDARWHAPVHCRHIRLEVMAFFSTLPGEDVCSYVYDRILTGETNSISGRPAANYACKARGTPGYAVR